MPVYELTGSVDKNDINSYLRNNTKRIEGLIRIIISFSKIHTD